MTNMENTTEVVLKTDTIGRVFTPLERRRNLLEEFEKSGLSGTKFAALAGVKYSTFASWLQKQRRKSSPSRGKEQTEEAGQVRWLETVIEQAQSAADKGRLPVVVQLPGGASLEMTTAGQATLVAALLSALEKPVGAC